MPTNVAGVLLGHRQAVTTAQLLARLHEAGLARYQESRLGPLLGPRPVRLWMLTAAGRAVVGNGALALSAIDRCQMPYGDPERSRDPARQRDIPLLVVCYRLLGEVVASPGKGHLVFFIIANEQVLDSG